MTGDIGAPATVLIAEDALVNRLALSRGVEHQGHRALQAADGREALEVLAREHVDMVLLDLVMPRVDGFAVLAAMRADSRLRDIPVLVVSAVEATQDVVRALEMGAIDCLPKPFEPALLRVRLRTALEQTRLRRLEQDYLRQELALRQQERLATLGRLSAGLGHELNNPAAAALSTTRQLRLALEDSDALLNRLLAHPGGAGLVEAAAELLRVDPEPTTAAERVERSEAVEASLVRLGVDDDSWSAATELCEIGVTPDQLEARLAGLGPDVGLALDWLRVRARIGRAVTHITTSVERMSDLTSALRSYTYLDRAPQQDVDVRGALDDTLTILAHKLPRAVTVKREYAAVLPKIRAYGGQLNQVWTNLLDNAIDAVGERGTVTVRARPDGAGVAVEVEDDGPGIAADLQGKVFDPFVTTKPPGQGTGLGLSISHQIVTEAHGGRLTVRSSPGSTVFEVRLPPTPGGGAGSAAGPGDG